MKEFYAIFILVGAVLLWTSGASACGDKLLHLSRIHRPGNNFANASVVFYSHPSSLLVSTTNSGMTKAFQDAGHKLVVADNERDFMTAIKSGNADVVVVDVADLRFLQELKSSQPLSVVAVLNKADREGERDGKRCDAMVKIPAKPGKFVDAVDHALDAKMARQDSHLRQSIFSR
jgi:hypothetical protein